MLNKEQNNEKKWVLLSETFKERDGEDAGAAVLKIAEELSLHPVTAQLLYNRGCHDAVSAKAFLCMENEILHDPFLLKDIEPALARIREAVLRGEKITVFGDYDVDGVTAVCILYLYLRSKGADVNYYIPNREGEGYGMSCSAIDALANGGTQLIITVDTGITAVKEVEYAKEKGLDVVVTDHHECHDVLPLAVAVVNPHRPDCPYPYKDLAGVGVAFRLICAYEERDTGASRQITIMNLCRQYADLVAIGTIADVMPLTGENKLVVSFGLQMIAKTERQGLRALIEVASARGDGTIIPFEQLSQKITSSYIGYTLAPRINAAGRVETASMAVELFLSRSHEEALTAAGKLCAANRRRQDEENRIIKEAYKKIEAEHDFSKDQVIVLDADHWHMGIIGIVASRITEEYGLPCILISFKGHMGDAPSPLDEGKGSGRSVKGMNLVDALSHCAAHLIKYGGHELAAGLSVTRENLPAFRRALNKYAREAFQGAVATPTLVADCRLTMQDMRLSLVREIHRLEPFGAGNPTPLFVADNLSVYECVGVRQNKHTRLVVGDESGRITAMYFSKSPEKAGIQVGDRVSLLFQLDENEWNGRTYTQMIVRDVHVSKTRESGPLALREDAEHRARFEEIWHGAPYTQAENVVPLREDFGDVYRYITAMVHNGQNRLSHRDILHGLPREAQKRIGYVKLKFIIRVFQEMNLLSIEERPPEVYSFQVSYRQNKVDLEKSGILRRLRSQQRG